MTAPPLTPTVTDAGPASGVVPTPRRGRSRRGVLALMAGLALAGSAVAVLATAAPDPVRPTFLPADAVTESAWGNEDFFGVAGSWIVAYEHDSDVTVRLPWDGDPIVDARIGADPVHLLTVTDVAAGAGTVDVTLQRGNCRFFHERAIDWFTAITLVDAGGDAHEVRFDKPVMVKSPMLAACPDRTIDRQDDTRGTYGG